MVLIQSGFQATCGRVAGGGSFLLAIISFRAEITKITNMSRVMNKYFAYADQLREYRTADQRLCFGYLDSTISLFPQL